MDTESADRIFDKYSTLKYLELDIDSEALLMESIYFLVHENHDPWLLGYLGDIYYEKERYDLAYKYWKKAVNEGAVERNYSIGELYYSGKIGIPDYKNAFRCFKKCINSEDEEEIVKPYKDSSRLKIAEMYKNGLYAVKNYDEYVNITNDLKETMHIIGEEISLTYYDKKWCIDDHSYDELVNLSDITYEKYIDRNYEYYDEENDSLLNYSAQCLYDAKVSLAYYIKASFHFKESLKRMKEIVCHAYERIDHDFSEVDEYDDIYDLYGLLDSPGKLNIIYKDNKYLIESKYSRNNEMAICFKNKWYRNLDDFFYKATLDSIPIVNLYDDITLEGIEDE